MFGAIIGDIVGSRFEIVNRKSKLFDLFTRDRHTIPNRFTDDTVTTIAIAEALMSWRSSGVVSYSSLSNVTIRNLQKLGRRYSDAGYGGSFCNWIFSHDPKPYGSLGNGAAMRVSPCGWLAHTLKEVKDLSYAVTSITHNHPEGLKGAEAVASIVLIVRKGASLKDVRGFINDEYYRLDFTLKDIRHSYQFDNSCQGSVPQAIEAFLESNSFEDALRNAISIGGDSDTIGAITGAMAEAYYGIPSRIRLRAETYLDPYLLSIVRRFNHIYLSK